MKLYILNLDPTKPCYVLSYKELLIMLDCGLTINTTLNFLPLPLVQTSNSLPNWTPRDHHDQMDGELKECCGKVFIDSNPEFLTPTDKIVDFAEIDIILISNYLNMLALPYITEQTGFKGIVYATEPTLQIGRFFLEELVEYIEASPKPNVASKWKDFQPALPSPLLEAVKPKTWRHIFSMEAVNKSLARVRLAGYDEKIDVFGALQVTAVSSGYCLGSSNWIITSGQEKISYVSGSSTLTTHPRPINQTALKYSDVVIMTGLTQAPHVNPDGMLGELCMNVAVTLRNGGSVLIPCFPSGVVYDLFECLSSNLDNAGLSQVPMFFISPVADSSLAYSNILAEWLSSVKQNKVYIPDEPFPHASLVRNGRLKHFQHIYSEGFSNEFRQPCIVFCGHPCLRFGDIIHFIEMWGSNALNTIIFTEPDFPYIQALAPFQPLAMKAVYCPIDTSLNFQQANKLIKELRPACLIVPKSYTEPPPMMPHKVELTLDQPPPERKLITFDRERVIKVPLKKSNVQATLSIEAAKTLFPREVAPGVSVAPLSGLLEVRDNAYTIKALSEYKEEDRKLAALLKESAGKAKVEVGALDVDAFLKKLTQEGIGGIKVEQLRPGAVVINLTADEVVIQVDETSTHVISKGRSQLRPKLREFLMQSIQSI